MVSVRSYLAASRRPPWKESRSPVFSTLAAGAFCRANITWKTGLRLRSRSGPSSSTIFSKGRSWCAYAPNVRSRTCRSSSRNGGSSDSSARSASVFTKKPISPSISLRLRLAMAVPTTTSSWPAYRDRSAWNAARSGMNSVASSSRASSRSAAATLVGTAKSTERPR